MADNTLEDESPGRLVPPLAQEDDTPPRTNSNPGIGGANAEPDWVLGGQADQGSRRWLAYPALPAEDGTSSVLLSERAMLLIELTDRRLVVLNLVYQRACAPLDNALIGRLAACVMAQIDRSKDGLVELWRRKGSTHVQFRGGQESFGAKYLWPRELAWSFALHADSDPLNVLFTHPDRLHKWIKAKGRMSLPAAPAEIFHHNAAWRALQKARTGRPPAASARERFILGLDRWSLNFCVRERLVCSKSYNYLQGDGCGVTQQRRRVAVKRLPLLAALASDPDTSTGGLFDAIDSGTAGGKALAIAYRIPFWVTSRLQSVSAQWLNLLDPENPVRHQRLRYLLCVLAAIGPDTWPSWSTEWEAFRDIFDAFLGCRPFVVINDMAEVDHRVAGALLRELGASGWCAARRRVERQYGSLSEFGGSIEFFSQLVQLFLSAEGRHELAKVCERRPASKSKPEAEQIIFAILRIAPARLLGAARRWKQAELFEAIAHRAAHAKATPLEFPLRHPLSMGGCFVHPLLDQAAMELEGLAMNNCVGRLHHLCRNSAQRVFSVRDGADHRLSTFDLTFAVSVAPGGAEELCITVISHKGRANREPGRQEQAVVDGFVAYLKENARELGLYEFTGNCACAEKDDLNWRGNLNAGEGEDEAVLAKLRAAAIVTREYLSDLASKL